MWPCVALGSVSGQAGNGGSVCGQSLRIRAQPVLGFETQSGLGSGLNLWLEIEPRIELPLFE